MKAYLERIIDKQLDLKLRAFGATHIVGPKWCGKTTSAEQKANSFVKFQKNPNKEALIKTAELNPSALLDGEKPRLIDEWQDAPNIWDAVRTYCDDASEPGQFILTGSTSKKVSTSHTGTGRISKLKMYPMSLFESKESNGSVSLSQLFEKKFDSGFSCHSDLSIGDLIFAACRGGWPASITLDDKEAQLEIAKDYFNQVVSEDINNVDGRNRNKKTMKALMRSYARNISTFAKNTEISADISQSASISSSTLDDYINVLEELFIVEDLDGWCPSIRSKTSMRAGKKREFTDPSLAVASLGLSPEILNVDLKTFGFIFECLCIRDLRVYSSALGGELSFYRDRYGLEADAVLHIDNGQYALIEIKLGGKEIEKGAEHLCEIEELIKEYNSKKENKIPLRLPDLKIVLTGTEYGYLRKDGVLVLPIGCLKD